MSTKVFFETGVLFITMAISCLPCFGQSSANFELLQAHISNGGGAVQSANLEITQSTIGGFAAGKSASSSFLLNGGTLVTSVEDGTPEYGLPASFLLLQNYPNPFNPETTIAYALPERSEVKINIFNALGQSVRTFEPGLQEAGQYRLQWDGKNHEGAQVSSGVYYYQMLSDGFVTVRKMLLLR